MEPAAEALRGRATLQVLDTKLEQLFKLRQGADRKGMAEHPPPKEIFACKIFFWGNSCVMI
jgi:hypothetical protein